MNNDEKDCPFCAERIKAKAIICRFCGKSLPEETTAAEQIPPVEWVAPPDLDMLGVTHPDVPFEPMRATVTASPVTPLSDGGSAFLRMVGAALVICGLCAAVYYFLFFETSVELPQQAQVVFGSGRVNNIGLMAEKQNGIIFGFGTFIVGALLMHVGRKR